MSAARLSAWMQARCTWRWRTLCGCTRHRRSRCRRGSVKLHDWQALFWKGDQPDGHPYNNREFAVQLHGGSVQLTSTPVSRLHRGHLYLDTPRGAVQVDRWHHVAAVLSSDYDGGAMRIYVDEETGSEPAL